jgi:succinate dehydrogenase/fumarate reductase flavoprotein subunit
MALRAGAALTNMEFMQYMLHRVQPFGVEAPGVIWSLIPEVRNTAGEEVLSRYLPEGVTPEQVMRQRTEHFPFSSRDHSKWLDITIASEVRAGRGDKEDCLLLDFSKVDVKGFVPSRPQHFPQDFTRPPEIKDPSGRVRISSHAINGGLLIDETAETTVRGLYAIGETAAGPHGADRLGGGMVSVGQVFGARAGRFAAEHVRQVRPGAPPGESLAHALDRVQSRVQNRGKGALDADALITELQSAVYRHMMVVRERRDLEQLLSRIAELRAEKLPALRGGTAQAKRAVEAENLLTTAELMATAGLLREESRGGHYRQDCPELDDAGQRSNIILRLQDGAIRHERRSLESQ